MTIVEWLGAVATSSAVVGVLTFIGTIGVKSSIEKRIQAHFDQKLEAMRSQFRREEEELKASLKAQEDRVSALRQNLLTR